MATRYEFQTLAARIKTVWGHGSQDWNRANNAYLQHADKIGRIPYADLLAAVESFIDEGPQWAPRIPQVLARARAGSSRPGRPDPGSCGHDGAVADLGGVLMCGVCLAELGGQRR